MNDLIKRYLFTLIPTSCLFAASLLWHGDATSYVPTPHAQFLTVQHGKIEYYCFGQGSPIVLISGYGTTVSSWNRYFLQSLAKKHEVIIFDNRNTGGTIIHSANYTTHDLAYDVATLMDGLHIKQATILGQSMGGMIAQQFAILYPHRVSHLILVNTAIAGKMAIPPDPVTEDFIAHTPQTSLKRIVGGLRLIAPPAWWLKMAYALEYDRFAPYHAPKELIPPTTLVQQRSLIYQWASNEHAAKQLRQLKIPTLILNGGADQVIPPLNSDILRHMIKGAKLIRFEDGGHAMLHQFPQQIAAAVLNFQV